MIKINVSNKCLIRGGVWRVSHEVVHSLNLSSPEKNTMKECTDATQNLQAEKGLIDIIPSGECTTLTERPRLTSD